MNAFWWFKDNIVAGMARPGFNCTHWFDLSYEEAALVGWLGQYSSGSVSRESLHQHIKTYCPKIAKFYSLSEEESSQITQSLYTKAGVEKILEKILNRSGLLKAFDVSEDQVSFTFCEKQLDREISFLKEKGFKKIISLTEDHHDKDSLQGHFDLYHFSIPDLEAPSFDQVD